MITYNPEISLGNILQIVTIAGSVLAAYSSLVQRDTAQEAAILQQGKEIARIEAEAKNSNVDVKSDIKQIGRDVRELDNKFTSYMIDNAKSHNTRPK